jgi:proline dehydrogenase
MALNFDNTEIAFNYKSNADLYHAYFMYKLLNNKTIVKIGVNTADKALKAGIVAPVALGMKPTIFKLFCGGETFEETEIIVRKLYSKNVKSILDYGIEGKSYEEDFIKTTKAILESITYAANNDAVDIICSKFTGLVPTHILEQLHDGKTLSSQDEAIYNNFLERVNQISLKAAQNNVALFIDAEESWIQNPLDIITAELMASYNTLKPVIYNTVQMYRHDGLEFFKNAHQKAKKGGYIYAAKIVRGAYMDKENKKALQQGYKTPIQPNKAATDRDYDLALEYAIQNIDSIAICVATHNEESCYLITKLMEKHKISPGHPHIHFSQLLGMSDNLSFNLANAGYNVAKYMPYGPVGDVIPYLMRRAQENTSVAGQMSREFQLIVQEMKRRNLFTI